MNDGPWKRFGLISIFLLVGSSNPIAIKAALNLGWPPFTLGLFRMGFIGLFFYVFAADGEKGIKCICTLPVNYPNFEIFLLFSARFEELPEESRACCHRIAG